MDHNIRLQSCQHLAILMRLRCETACGKAGGRGLGSRLALCMWASPTGRRNARDVMLCKLVVHQIPWREGENTKVLQTLIQVMREPIHRLTDWAHLTQCGISTLNLERPYHSVTERKFGCKACPCGGDNQTSTCRPNPQADEIVLRRQNA